MADILPHGDRRGICKVCARLVTKNLDDSLRKHKADGERCPGSNTQAAPTHCPSCTCWSGWNAGGVA